MKSLIKSHRRSTSLDSSPTKSPRNRDTLRSNNEPSSPTPLGLYQSDSSVHPPRHSSSFESLPKLSNKNKIFTTKLFKKTSNSSSNQSKPGTAAGTPTNHSFKQFPSPDGYSSGTFERIPQKTPKGTVVEGFPAIKGTRTHEWGDISEGSQSVIVLNRSSLSSDVSSDAGEPGIIAYSTNNRESISTAASSSVSNTRRSSYDSQIPPSESLLKLQDISEIKEKHPYFSLRSNNIKNKNRQVQIHSHEDIISLGKQSGLSFEYLSSHFNSQDGTESSPNISKHNSQQEPQLLPNQEVIGLGLGIEDYESSTSAPSPLQDSSTVEINKLINNRSFDEGDELFLTSHKEKSVHDDENFEDDNKSSFENSSDESSKFSFEFDGLNGRTSSVKYYSKPQPFNNVYIDDLYDDEDFDEDVNYCDEDDLCSMQDDTVHLFSGNYFKDVEDNNEGKVALSDDHKDEDDSNLEECAGNIHELKGYSDIYNLSDNDSDFEKKQEGQLPNQNLKVSRYRDLFDLSDDESFNGEEYDAGDDFESYLDEERNNTKYVLSKDAKLQDEDALDVKAPQHNMKITGTDSASRVYTTGNTSPLSLTSTTSDNNLLRSPFAATLPPATSEIYTKANSQPSSRFHSLKYHDMSCNLDYEVPGAMSNLFFIDESEEDRYNKENQSDEHYLDEINDIPEDFSFSEGDDDLLSPSRLSGSHIKANSFKRTHSFSEKPVPAVKEKSPIRYKLELKNKTVTFFNNEISRSISDSAMYNLVPEKMTISSRRSPEPCHDQSSPLKTEVSPVTPSNSFSRPSPYFSQGNSLSPIQESNSSVDNSPKPTN